MSFDLALVGAAAFGSLIGWYTYYVNRYRGGPVQFSDLVTLIGIIGGGTILGLFGSDKEQFGAYGIGLFAGFFLYFLVLLLFVGLSKSFTVEWFLDGRRKDPDSGWGYGVGTRPTMSAMSDNELVALRDQAARAAGDRGLPD